MDPLVARVRNELLANADEETRRRSQRFFKESIQCYGVKTPTVGKIAKKHWKEAASLGKQKIFALCNELLSSGFTEEAFVVSYWLPNLAEKLEPEDLDLFSAWIEKYLDNWAKLDGFCNHTVGGLVERHPEEVSQLKRWTGSSSRWLKRAAAVSLIVPAKQGKFLPEVFEISDALLSDEDDLVQKGYGWLLKEASRIHQAEVFNYVMKNRQTMPRTALRYAIELMPKELKQEAMKRAL